MQFLIEGGAEKRHSDTAAGGVYTGNGDQSALGHSVHHDRTAGHRCANSPHDRPGHDDSTFGNRSLGRYGDRGVRQLQDTERGTYRDCPSMRRLQHSLGGPPLDRLDSRKRNSGRDPGVQRLHTELR
jgi:hypothetical protein